MQKCNAKNRPTKMLAFKRFGCQINRNRSMVVVVGLK